MSSIKVDAAYMRDKKISMIKAYIDTYIYLVFYDKILYNQNKFMQDYITIYTDGACIGNPGKGGYGFILQYKEHYKEGFGGFLLTTNNRMELMGVIRALMMIRSPLNIVLYTDSKYIQGAIEEGWLARWQRSGWVTGTKKPVKNRDLWEQVYILLNRYSVQFKWVKAHNGNQYNERCDALAKQGARMENQERDTVFEKTQKLQQEHISFFGE